MRHVNGSLTVLAAVALLAGAAPAVAQQRPLPAFQVVRPADGVAVDSARLSGDSHWVLLYVHLPCGPCEKLLKAIPTWESPAVAAKTVVVIGGPIAETQKWLGRAFKREQLQLPWLADPDGAAFRAIDGHGVPTLLGIGSGTVKWAITGVLNDPEALKKTLISWTERP
jgi:hypothetical protein